MVKNLKATGTRLFSMLLAATLFFALFAVPVSAKKAHAPNKNAYISANGEDVEGVHADILKKTSL